MTGNGSRADQEPTARRMRWCWRSASCWCVSAIRPSTRCGTTLPSSASSRQRHGQYRAPDGARAAGSADATRCRPMLGFLAHLVKQPHERIRLLEVRMRQMAGTDPVAIRLAQVPGVGPIGAITLEPDGGCHAVQLGSTIAAWLVLPGARSATPRTRKPHVPDVDLFDAIKYDKSHRSLMKSRAPDLADLLAVVSMRMAPAAATAPKSGPTV